VDERNIVLRCVSSRSKIPRLRAPVRVDRHLEGTRHVARVAVGLDVLEPGRHDPIHYIATRVSGTLRRSIGAPRTRLGRRNVHYPARQHLARRCYTGSAQQLITNLSAHLVRGSRHSPPDCGSHPT
jgi:hypothetical protein